MTETKYDKLVTRIFWFTLPLVIGLLTWLVIQTYELKENVSKDSQKIDNIVNIQEKMWNLIQENNKILGTKADKDENTKDHEYFMIQLHEINQKLALKGINGINKISETYNNFDTIHNQVTYSAPF